jgi:hypothetical protein
MRFDRDGIELTLTEALSCGIRVTKYIERWMQMAVSTLRGGYDTSHRDDNHGNDTSGRLGEKSSTPLLVLLLRYHDHQTK